MGLATKPKNLQVKEVNQEGVLHIPQQEDLKIIRQRTRFRDTLNNGDMKFIKEVLEVPTSQSGTEHAIVLVTLLHIVIR